MVSADCMRVNLVTLLTAYWLLQRKQTQKKSSEVVCCSHKALCCEGAKMNPPRVPVACIFPVCVLEVAADTSDCINFMGIILIIQDADKAPSCARDGEGADLGCPTFRGSSQMTVSFWENDFLFFFLYQRGCKKTPKTQWRSIITVVFLIKVWILSWTVSVTSIESKGSHTIKIMFNLALSFIGKHWPVSLFLCIFT